MTQSLRSKLLHRPAQSRPNLFAGD